MPNFLSPFMYGDPNFRVPSTFNNSNNMLPIVPFISAGAGVLNGIVGAFGANKRQKRAIQNQWAMFEAQKQHQNEVNERAMAFQREMNQRNEEWNTESNVRQRIEDAGYNPYLYQNGAMASNVNQSTPLAQNVAPTSPVDLPDPFSEFAHSAIDSVKGIAEVLLQRQNARKVAANAATEEYMLDRQQRKDNQKYAGLDLPTAEAWITHSNLEESKQRVIQQTVITELATLKASAYKAPAFDENDQPITDESGRQLTMSEVSDRSILKSNLKQLDKLFEEIESIKSVTEYNKVKKKLEQYNLDFLAPAQLSELHQRISEIGARIKEIDASAKFTAEQTNTERVKRTGEKIMNGLKAKDYENYNVDKWFRRFGMMSSSANSGANAAANVAKVKKILKTIK